MATKKRMYFSIVILSFFVIPFFTQAQIVNVDASKLISHVEVSLSPRSGSFVEGSTFQVPILVNTHNISINGIEVRINFDKDKLSIINPTGNKSIISVWVEPPVYDNIRGTATYVGVVPGGIIADSGLVGMITFKAKATGTAVVSISSNSKILLNDGLATEAQVDSVRASYNILTKAPEGVQVFSETHPIQSDWYNNNNLVFSWSKDPGVNGFSFILDNKPNTIPDDTVDTEDTLKSFEAISDGLFYFHIKGNKAGVWGATGHFITRIDTAPPAKFKPVTEFLVSANVFTERTLVSFITTDNLSGVDHYELGIIDKSQPATESPVFVQAESPFQVPLNVGGKLQVIVRAIDKAGNVRDESIDVRRPFVITKFVQDYIVYILLAIILLGFVMLILHYFFGHHIMRHVRRVIDFIKKEKNEDHPEEP